MVATILTLCALRDGSDALSEVNFVIEDLQGSDTLLKPYVAYRNVSIPVTESSIPAPSSEEIAAAKAEGQTLVPAQWTAVKCNILGLMIVMMSRVPCCVAMRTHRSM